MKIIIENEVVNDKLITFSEIGFGEHLKKKKGVFKIFKLTTNIEYFINRFNSIYNSSISDLIADDEITGEFYPPFIGAEDYPSLNEFLHLPEKYRMEMIETYFTFDILRLYFSEDNFNSQILWMIDSLDSFQLCGTKIIMKGQALLLN